MVRRPMMLMALPVGELHVVHELRRIVNILHRAVKKGAELLFSNVLDKLVYRCLSLP